MATFMDSLASNPSGSSIYGQPGQHGVDIIGLMNNIKDRQLQDYKAKAQFDSDLNFHNQARMRRIFDPNGMGQSEGQQQQSSPQMSVVQRPDPNMLTAYERGELGFKNNQLAQERDLETKKLAQSRELGQENLGVRSAQEKVNAQRANDLNEHRNADLERRINDANNNLGLNYEKLNSNNNNVEARINAMTDAANKRFQAYEDNIKRMSDSHAADLAQRDERIAALEKATRAKNAPKKVTTEVDPTGSKKTVTTQSGYTYTGTGKDGRTYQVPEDKIDDWNKNHAKPGTEISIEGPEEPVR